MLIQMFELNTKLWLTNGLLFINFDTGGNRGVVIRNNRFTGCVGGGSVNDG